MDLGTLDFWAVSGQSSLHRASAPYKMVAAALLVAAVVATTDPLALLAIYLTAAAGAALARLPIGRVLAVAAYPALFALLFAVARWDGSPVGPLMVVGRAMSAAAVMVVLVATTPYPRIFAVLRRLLPPLVADALFLTYRSLFLLLALLGHLLAALRLRGGLTRHRYRQSSRSMAIGLGLLLVRAIALSERIYDVLRLRGYSGRLAGAPVRWRPSRYDLLPMAAGCLALGAVLAFRFEPAARQYNGLLLALAAASLAAALLAGRLAAPGTG